MDFMSLLMGGIFGDVDNTELDKLERLLVLEDIPFKRTMFSQICYYGPNGKPESAEKPGVISGPGVGAICSVISHGYGSSEGLLEISGLMTEEEVKRENDTVLGYLTAENVFERIKKHYEANK